MANLPKGGWVTPVCIMGDVRDPLWLHLNQNDLKLGRKWVMANLPTRGWMNPVCIMRERRDQLGLHLNQKDLKFGKESLSYG